MVTSLKRVFGLGATVNFPLLGPLGAHIGGRHDWIKSTLWLLSRVGRLRLYTMSETPGSLGYNSHRLGCAHSVRIIQLTGVGDMLGGISYRGVVRTPVFLRGTLMGVNTWLTTCSGHCDTQTKSPRTGRKVYCILYRVITCAGKRLF